MHLFCLWIVLTLVRAIVPIVTHPPIDIPKIDLPALPNPELPAVPQIYLPVQLPGNPIPLPDLSDLLTDLPQLPSIPFVPQHPSELPKPENFLRYSYKWFQLPKMPPQVPQIPGVLRRLPNPPVGMQQINLTSVPTTLDVNNLPEIPQISKNIPIQIDTNTPLLDPYILNLPSQLPDALQHLPYLSPAPVQIPAIIPQIPVIDNPLNSPSLPTRLTKRK